MLESFLHPSLPQRQKFFRLIIIFLITLGTISGIWTARYQHAQIQEQQRSKILAQLGQAFSGLLRDQPTVLEPWSGQLVMIGASSGTALCPAVKSEITVTSQIAEQLQPYLSRITYDAAMPRANLSGWYLDVSAQQLKIGACLSADNYVILNY